jgi:hypothetical protein
MADRILAAAASRATPLAGIELSESFTNLRIYLIGIFHKIPYNMTAQRARHFVLRSGLDSLHSPDLASLSQLFR